MLAVTTGTGAYEGLSAMVFLDTVGDGSRFELEGMILPSDLLVSPE